MAYANARVQSLGATAPRQASLINGLRYVSRNAVRTRLPCGCLTHKHTCQKHAVTTAHAGSRGSPSVGALSTACPAESQSCRGVNGQLFASAARPSRHSASVSSTAVFTSLVGCLPWQRPCVISKPLQQRAGRVRRILSAMPRVINPWPVVIREETSESLHQINTGC